MHFYSVVCCCLLAASSVAQSAAPAAPVFRVQSKLVLVDVVVTEKNGKVVEGLKPVDFEVRESGVPQRIRFFEDHSVPKERPAMQAPQLPEGQYTNFPTQAPKDTVNVLLFDLLNTAPSEQLYARKQMLKAIKAMPPGQQLAVFVLAGRLQMIQGPTGDSSLLAKAADELDDSAVSEKKDASMASASSTAANTANQSQAIGGQSLQAAFGSERSVVTGYRVDVTLGALQAIARTLSSYPGRKNLIWLTGGVPFQVGPDMTADKYTRWRNTRDYQEQIAKATSLLADAQVAIYPVDVRGMSVQNMDKQITTLNISGTGGEYQSSINTQSEDQWDNRVAMSKIAEETGGRAYYGSNDLAKSLKTAIQTGARYYTLAYVPSNGNPDGKYRPIEVKTSRSGVQLSYRKGYMAFKEKQPSETDSLQTLVSMMQPGMPPSTTLLMRVKVDPPAVDRKGVRIDYAVSPDDVQFDEAADHTRKGTIDFMAVAWDSKGAVVGQTKNSVTTTVQPETAASVLKTGIPSHLDMGLKPGAYSICIGAIDRASQKMGTLWINVTVPE